MTGIILAGGKGSRLGNINKALIKLGGVTIIERVIEGLKKTLFDEIIICGGQNPIKDTIQEARLDETRLDGLTPIEDIIPHKGPLVGLYSGLMKSTSFYNFVVAGDMPFLNTNLIKYMKDKISGSDVLIPKTQRGVEPLHAIYSKNCLEIIKRKIFSEKACLVKEKLSIESIFSELKVEYILEDEIRQFSLPEIAFFNINTEQDIEKAKRLVEELRMLSKKLGELSVPP
ncbi:MAG: molybdenum cofactor guanylyltransferase [Nitrospirota bacterium]